MKGRTIPETNDDESYLSACHNAPSEFDWRTHGYVSPVKSQGRCGAASIFASVGSLEGVYAIAKRVRFQELSTENVIDCIPDFTCRGGTNVVAVYKYIQENGGIDSAACYHSSTSKQKCHYNKSCKAAKCNGYKWVKKNEDSLKCSLVSVGPIAVSLDVNHRSFWLYKNGIWYNPRCSKDRPNHVMLAVGYGTESKGMDYWIIKNSWGTSWGKQGYVFTSRNRNNMCGVASNATYPAV
ncbi:cathepsin K-like [Mercenaria mercenaria]|uniref:cathepsin K-like n=1 Tax=Mercenaria mercenaria TaxID=6596 RepID=UPI00234FACFA|nr:cathepsin K-like [Mercenaria mercenaria]